MKLLPLCRDCNSHFPRFELAALLLRLEHIAASSNTRITAATFALDYLLRCRCFLLFLFGEWAARHSRCFRV
jgi:hypothetical protein